MSNTTEFGNLIFFELSICEHVLRLITAIITILIVLKSYDSSKSCPQMDDVKKKSFSTNSFYCFRKMCNCLWSGYILNLNNCIDIRFMVKSKLKRQGKTSNFNYLINAKSNVLTTNP